MREHVIGLVVVIPGIYIYISIICVYLTVYIV